MGEVSCQGSTELDIIAKALETPNVASGPEARRLLHGRGGTLPGLEFINIDWIPPVLSVVLHEERDAAWKAGLRGLLLEKLSGMVQCIVVQNRNGSQTNSEIAYGDMPEHLDLLEDGLRYRVDLLRNQNTGFFMDMRLGRRYLKKLAAGRSVLNLFSYTCSFSVCAMQAGARQVINMDMGRRFLERGKLNHHLNGLYDERCRFFPGDIMKSLSRMRRYAPYDLVVIDPPFRQAGSFNPDRDYDKLLRWLPQVCQAPCDILASVNDPFRGPEFMLDKIRSILPKANLVRQFGPGDDFPEADAHRALKVFHFHIAMF